MNILKKCKEFIFGEDDIPYLELHTYEESWNIPYLQPTRLVAENRYVKSQAISAAPAIPSQFLERLTAFYEEALMLITQIKSLSIFTIILASISTYYSFINGTIVSYGDAESHLNIAKRVIDSITPGLSQLGGIWLPIPHLLMLPFVTSDFLWRTGLAGSLVSSISYGIAAVYLYKLVMLFTRNRLASFVTFLVFALNPNILYLQSTPMTELPLILFFVLSTYYFVRYLKDDREIMSLMGAAFFAFCASLSRYDGWFLVLIEAAILFLYHFPGKVNLKKLTGKMVFFSSLAFFGMISWIIWGFLILGDPFYFTTSEFSAKSQQEAWHARGELPSYHNFWSSIQYYTYTAMENVGMILFVLSIIGLGIYLFKRPDKTKVLISLLLLCPFIFYVVTLYLGQSVIFIPGLTPDSFSWNLFNVRYGVMMVPICAAYIGYFVAKSRPGMKVNILILIAFQTILFANHTAPIISLADGVDGLSQYKETDAQDWIKHNYDSGLVLEDDFSRSISIIRSTIPMKNIIYIGNQPYWQESLETPQKHATWIIMQRNDSIWNSLYEKPEKQALLYTYFNKVYTSPDILIFKRI